MGLVDYSQLGSPVLQSTSVIFAVKESPESPYVDPRSTETEPPPLHPLAKRPQPLRVRGFTPAVPSIRRIGMTASQLQGYPTHKPPPPQDPTVALCLGTYGDPRGAGVSDERGTSVARLVESVA